MYLLVSNPTAQSGRNAARIDRAREVLVAHGLLHRFLATEPEGRTVAVVAQAIKQEAEKGQPFKAVIAMGGDGTFSEVAKGVLASGVDVPLAFLPTGTANDQGRSFGLSAGELEENIAVIAAGHTAPLDAGHIEAFDDMKQKTRDDWFFDSAGWGLSARILKERNFDRSIVSSIPLFRELYRDQLVYAGAMMRVFATSYMEDQVFEATITLSRADGTTETVFMEGLTDLLVKNTRYYGGAWVFDPTSSPEDGEMELVPLRSRNEWLARAIVNLDGLPLPNNIPLVKFTPVQRASRFHIELHDRPLAPPIEAQIDGEEWVRSTHIEVTVVHRALKLVVPQARAGG